MNKDVIYIDVDDDITAIIGKVKDAKEKIVALVPPKRIGVLQSAVNLRLLARAAKQSDKRLVLITSNSALGALASAAQVPVAKNLQSKPEMAEIAALDIDNGEDVIDGAKLPVGEHAKTAAAGDSAVDEALRENAAEASRATPPGPGQSPSKPKAKNGAKVPNFNKFRKKLIIIIAAAVLLLGFLVWAIFFAGSAKVIITARTADAASDAKVALGDELETSAEDSTLKTVTHQVKKELSVDFEATGKKDVGEKAKGTMKLTRTSVSSNPIRIPAGTSFSSNGRTFVSTQATTLSGTTVGPGGIEQDSATVGVAATEMGDEYNLSARSYEASVGGISARGSEMSGGSKKTVTVVSANDVQEAAGQLANQDAEDIKKQLQGEFDDGFIVLDQTFRTDEGSPQSNPAVGQEASGGKAKLTASVTYRLMGVARAEVDNFLTTYFKEQTKDEADRRIYDNGAKKVTFTNVILEDDSVEANVVATAKIGPHIDDEEIKNLAKGKRYGEIQASIEKIQGVDDVDVKFSPFWVSVAPDDTKKISVDFNLNEPK